ncbi:uncharacterized protein LOC119562559 isoform X2 [Drosophila subpulchrella]|uniref:uncharacterized protein LOC119559631 isoform X2 n=2 Tax=Drosophila subpulchrella TaxID=1486046 RepID=UPI0018A169EE|nr:uncharacterized protein LOC119559631 isoform X2 [Drosophila subpulchrella]XP_037728719.1 uncharacterized protein LOC119559725 isoform X2 [Drosophila subpulchrella]XP_037731610.1 uncharacterized protein LOC119562481 isoform X2 [Drosophila subpulchrella]XP_037731690.1 uncharacterized protein LOC119562559 isoform X2 [Drosophila subpulchrella]
MTVFIIFFVILSLFNPMVKMCHYTYNEKGNSGGGGEGRNNNYNSSNYIKKRTPGRRYNKNSYINNYNPNQSF